MRRAVASLAFAAALVASAAAQADTSSCMEAAMAQYNCYMNGPPGQMEPWMTPNLDNDTAVANSPCCSFDVVTACGSAKGFMELWSQNPFFFDEKATRVLQVFATGCPVDTANYEICHNKLTTLATCLSSNVNSNECCAQWSGIGKDCLRVNGIAFEYLFNSSIPPMVADAARRLSDTCPDFTAEDCWAAVRRSVDCTVAKGYSMLPATALTNAHGCDEIFGGGAVVCDGFPTNIIHDYVTEAVATANASLFVYDTIFTNVHTMHTTGGHNNGTNTYYPPIGTNGTNTYYPTPASCGAPLPDLFSYYGMVVTPVCPQPAMYPDAMGGFPPNMCNTPSFVQLMGKNYYLVSYSLSQGNFVDSPAASCGKTEYPTPMPTPFPTPYPYPAPPATYYTTPTPGAPYYNPTTQTYQSGPADLSPQYFNPATGGYYPTVTNTHTMYDTTRGYYPSTTTMYYNPSSNGYYPVPTATGGYYPDSSSSSGSGSGSGTGYYPGSTGYYPGTTTTSGGATTGYYPGATTGYYNPATGTYYR